MGSTAIYDFNGTHPSRVSIDMGGNRTSKYSPYILLFLSFISLAVGCSIYLFFREIPPVLNAIITNLNLSHFIYDLRAYSYGALTNEILLYNLPDGLWITSYLFFIASLLNERAKWELMLWVAPIPISSMICECLQYIHYIPGTFDVKDIIAYLLPTVIFEILIYFRK